MHVIHGTGTKSEPSKYQQVTMSMVVTLTSTKCQQVNISTNNNIDSY